MVEMWVKGLRQLLGQTDEEAEKTLVTTSKTLPYCTRDCGGGKVTQGTEDLKVVIAGLSNAYTHYVTTFEEYQRQRYEAASTIFGPHTLRAYMDQYAYLTEKMLNVRFFSPLC